MQHTVPAVGYHITEPGGKGFFCTGDTGGGIYDALNEYYLAESADELLSVFADVPAHLVTARVTTEVSAIFAAIGALFAFSAVALAQRWNPLPSIDEPGDISAKHDS